MNSKSLILSATFLCLSISRFCHSQERAYFQIDISDKANMGFQDEKENDRTGGWADRGKNDMRGFPVGTRNFGEIPFSVIDPKANNGKSVIILQSKGRAYFPKQAEGIKINKPVSKLFFLNACDTNSPKGHLVAKYIVHYANGIDLEIPVRFGIDTGNNWLKCNETNMPNAKNVWKGNNPQAETGAFLSRWVNPNPGFIIQSIDFISTASKTSPALIALTAELSAKADTNAPTDNKTILYLVTKIKKLEQTVDKLSTKNSSLESRLTALEKTQKNLNDDVTLLWNTEDK